MEEAAAAPPNEETTGGGNPNLEVGYGIHLSAYAGARIDVAYYGDPIGSSANSNSSNKKEEKSNTNLHEAGVAAVGDHSVTNPLADDQGGPGPQNGFNQQKNVFSFSKFQPAYGLSEGLGAFAGYRIYGTIMVVGNKVIVRATGSTEASSQNNTYFKGSVTNSGSSSYGTSLYKETQALTIDTSIPLAQRSDHQHIGSAVFNVPVNIKTYNVSVSGGYVFKNGDNHYSVPIPANTTYTLRITKK